MLTGADRVKLHFVVCSDCSRTVISLFIGSVLGERGGADSSPTSQRDFNLLSLHCVDSHSAPPSCKNLSQSSLLGLSW